MRELTIYAITISSRNDGPLSLSDTLQTEFDLELVEEKPENEVLVKSTFFYKKENLRINLKTLFDYTDIPLQKPPVSIRTMSGEEYIKQANPKIQAALRDPGIAVLFFRDLTNYGSPQQKPSIHDYLEEVQKILDKLSIPHIEAISSGRKGLVDFLSAYIDPAKKIKDNYDKILLLAKDLHSTTNLIVESLKPKSNNFSEEERNYFNLLKKFEDQLSELIALLEVFPNKDNTNEIISYGDKLKHTLKEAVLETAPDVMKKAGLPMIAVGLAGVLTLIGTPAMLAAPLVFGGIYGNELIGSVASISQNKNDKAA